jgi:hypothetical protein
MKHKLYPAPGPPPPTMTNDVCEPDKQHTPYSAIEYVQPEGETLSRVSI